MEYKQLCKMCDTEKSCCPKCHPYIAGCIVVVIFLFSAYHANDIKHFVTSFFQINSNASESPASGHPEFGTVAAAMIDNTTTANSVQLQQMPILLLTLTILPNILV